MIFLFHLLYRISVCLRSHDKKMQMGRGASEWSVRRVRTSAIASRTHQLRCRRRRRAACFMRDCHNNTYIHCQLVWIWIRFLCRTLFDIYPIGNTQSAVHLLSYRILTFPLYVFFFLYKFKTYLHNIGKIEYLWLIVAPLFVWIKAG